MILPSKKIAARFYETGAGRKPVREWLMELSDDDRRIVGKDVQKVEFGWPIGMPYCRPLSDGLWEVRSSLSHNRISRIIFCIMGNQMILLHAFIKKTQKTPPQEIETAQKRRGDIGHD